MNPGILNYVAVKLFVFVLLMFFALVADLSYAAIAKIFFFSAVSLWIYSKFFSKEIKDRSLKLSFRFFMYVLWILKEIFVSALILIQVVLFIKTENIRPVRRIIRNEGTDVEDAVYGNSITLTPGTLTMKIDEGSVKVHSISSKHHNILVRSKILPKIHKSQR